MKWTLDATNMPGPIQFNKTKKAIEAIMNESMKHDEVDSSGVRYTLTVLRMDGTTRRPDCAAAYQLLGETFGWVISKTNHKEIIRAAVDAMVTLLKNRPLVTKGAI